MNRYPTHLRELVTVLGDEDKCVELMARIRWPHGFRCPHCRASKATRLHQRPIWRCRECGRQTRLTANTALHGTHVSMSRWLQAIFTFAKKSDVSGVQLAKDLGVAETTAMFMLRRIRAFLDERGRSRLFRGMVDLGVLQLDPRDAREKPRSDLEQHRRRQDLVVVVERISYAQAFDLVTKKTSARRWQFGSMRICAIPRGLDPARFASEHVAAHKLPADATSFPITQTLLGNARSVVRGAFHGVSTKYLDSYLRAFAFRFNRREREDVLSVLMMRRLFRGKPCTRAEVSTAAARPSLVVAAADVPPPNAATKGLALPTTAPSPEPAATELDANDEVDRVLAMLAVPTGMRNDDATLAAIRALGRNANKKTEPSS